MPRLIDPGTPAPLSFEDFCDALDASTVDCEDEEAFASLAPLLAGLGRNRDFLGHAALEALQRSDTALPGQGYGAQVLLLRPPCDRFIVRAAFWPSPDDAAMRSSGGRHFYYGVPHNHDFAFLTYGYCGPGYESDYWDFDPDAVAGQVGETAYLRALGRYRLAPDTLMLNRKWRDVHSQHPPRRFSVSLNILARPSAHQWREQFRFDTQTDTIAQVLSAHPSEPLLRLAANISDEGRDLAASFAAHHASDTMRRAALRACVGARVPGSERLLRDAADGPARALAGEARALLDQWHRNGGG